MVTTEAVPTAVVHFSGICTHVRQGFMPGNPNQHLVVLADVRDEATYGGVPGLKGLPPHAAAMRVDPRYVWPPGSQTAFDLTHYELRFSGPVGPLRYDESWFHVPGLSATAPDYMMPPVLPSMALVQRSAAILPIASGTMSAVNYEPASEGAAADWTFEVEPAADGTRMFTIDLVPLGGNVGTKTVQVRVPEQLGPAAVPLVWIENAGIDDDDRVHDFLFHYYALFGSDVPKLEQLKLRNQNNLILGGSAGCSNSNFP